MLASLTLEPGVEDLFGTELNFGFDFVFDGGDTALAGGAWDEVFGVESLRVFPAEVAAECTGLKDGMLVELEGDRTWEEVRFDEMEEVLALEFVGESGMMHRMGVEFPVVVE